MKLRSIFILFIVVFASAAAACAQAGVYVMLDAQRFTRNGLLASPPSTSTNVDSPWLLGPTFGAYLDFGRIPMLGKYGKLHTGPFILGIDARGQILRTWDEPVNRDDGLVSLRLATRKPLKGITPYIQGGAGVGHTRVVNQTNYVNNWSYEFGLGADRRLSRHLDWRVIEASAGFLGNYVAGTSPTNSNYLINLGTGLVVRFP